mmetsp:Transcript_9370/g.20154  ORF Transcript_9370/g.20154 Transcript_9370/m.20154 type:complete len:370 (-) Transcript_9370:1020-2129(-)
MIGPVDLGDNNHRNNRIHPEFRSNLLYRFTPNFLLYANYDSWWKTSLLQCALRIPFPPGNGVQTKYIPNIGHLYLPSARKPASATTTPSALLWLHCGGRIFGSSCNIAQSAVCTKLVRSWNLPVLSVSYRLAPEHVFPAALEDVLAAYRWLVDYLNREHPRGNGSARDPNCDDGTDETTIRIAVGGESAGGGLAAELCQRLLDETKRCGNVAGVLPLPVAQLLVYPMLDDRTCIQTDDMASRHHHRRHLVWNIVSNRYAWKCYLGPDFDPGDDVIPEYAAAARRVDVTDLPPAFVICGELDLFREESERFAERLKTEGNVDAEYVEVEGGFHLFLTLDAIMEVYFGRREGEICGDCWRKLAVFANRYLH